MSNEFIDKLTRETQDLIQRRVKATLDEVGDAICENYCKYYTQYGDCEELYTQHCNKCPLGKLI